MSEQHSRQCGTAFRGCAPDCPKDLAEKQLDRPPIGIMPRKIWLEKRTQELVAAFERYFHFIFHENLSIEEMGQIPLKDIRLLREWLDEINDNNALIQKL